MEPEELMPPTTTPPPSDPPLISEIETNNTILSANEIQFVDPLDPLASPTPVKIDGAIATGRDVDLFAVELAAGDTLVANLDAMIGTSTLDGVISIFDENGNLLVQNDNNTFIEEGMRVIEPDPFQQFTALEDGTYYVGVSSSPNLRYNPTVDPTVDPTSRIGRTTGSYFLELAIMDEPLTDDVV